MKFNKIIRGAKRAANNEPSVYEILDAGFLCHVAFQHQGQTMMIPTAYGRKDDSIYLHGSAKNFMLNQIVKSQTVCISVTHLDGLVLARNLFHTSVNYRSAVLFGKAIMVKEEDERMEGLRIITENIIKGRWDEVPAGSEKELAATIVIKFKIETASAKIRTGGPMGDEAEPDTAWSGVIPLSLKALAPIADDKFKTQMKPGKSVNDFVEKYQ